jgi:ribosomal protein L11 methyltransferase
MGKPAKKPLRRLWSVIVELAFKPAEDWRLRLEAAIESFGEALVSFEQDGGKGWRIETIGGRKPSLARLKQALKNFPGLRPSVAQVPEKDWLAESRKGLAPFSVGPFYLHGMHDRGVAPRGKIALEIDASMAFGTGRHETTRLCLKAMLRLSRRRRFKRPLDIGTGTGILAFAAAHLFGVPVLACDNDKDAVRLARENAIINGLQDKARILRSNGYRAGPIRDGGPYDLVTSNILANPLIALAPHLARHLARNGRAILSGLVIEHEKSVLDAHAVLGLILDFRLRENGWSCLVLKRGKAKRAPGKSARGKRRVKARKSRR